jgi:hypothetical protein
MAERPRKPPAPSRRNFQREVGPARVGGVDRSAWEHDLVERSSAVS